MRTLASYRIFGDQPALTAERVTVALGLEPSKTWEVGGQRGNAPPASGSGWLLTSSDEPEVGVELSEQLRKVTSTLRPRRDALWRLFDEGYRADWFCYVGSHATEHAAELSRTLLSELLDLPGDLLLDIYCDGPDD